MRFHGLLPEHSIIFNISRDKTKKNRNKELVRDSCILFLILVLYRAPESANTLHGERGERS